MTIDPAQNLCSILGPEACLGHAGQPAQRSERALRAAASLGSSLRGAAAPEPGEFVLLAVPDPLAALVAFVSLVQLDLIPVPVDPHVGAATLGPILETTGARLALVGAGLPPTTRAGLAASCVLVETGELDFDSTADLPTPKRRGDDTALVVFTSGSTGRPKGVLASHRNILATIRAILAYLPVVEHRRTGLLLPLHYSYALVGQALVTWAAAGDICFIPGLPGVAVEALRSEAIQGISSVPTSLRLLCEVITDDNDPLSRVGYVASAGARLPTELHPALAQSFPNARLFNQYGCTEATPRVSYIESSDPRFQQGAIGFPIAELEVAILDDHGEPLGPGEEGDLGIRGPNVTAGYLSAGAPGPGLRRGGYLLNGDRAYADDDGCLYLVGRRDRLVNCGGERVSLDQIEEVIRRHSSVGEAAVVVADDPLLGTRIAAFVRGDRSQVAALRQHLSQALSPAQRPVLLQHLERLPQLSSGKMDIKALLSLWSDHG